MYRERMRYNLKRRKLQLPKYSILTHMGTFCWARGILHGILGIKFTANSADHLWCCKSSMILAKILLLRVVNCARIFPLNQCSFSESTVQSKLQLRWAHLNQWNIQRSWFTKSPFLMQFTILNSVISANIGMQLLRRVNTKVYHAMLHDDIGLSKFPVLSYAGVFLQ